MGKVERHVSRYPMSAATMSLEPTCYSAYCRSIDRSISLSFSRSGSLYLIAFANQLRLERGGFFFDHHVSSSVNLLEKFNSSKNLVVLVLVVVVEEGEKKIFLLENSSRTNFPSQGFSRRILNNILSLASGVIIIEVDTNNLHRYLPFRALSLNSLPFALAANDSTLVTEGRAIRAISTLDSSANESVGNKKLLLIFFLFGETSSSRAHARDSPSRLCLIVARKKDERTVFPCAGHEKRKRKSEKGPVEKERDTYIHI